MWKVGPRWQKSGQSVARGASRKPPPHCPSLKEPQFCSFGSCSSGAQSPLLPTLGVRGYLDCSQPKLALSAHSLTKGLIKAGTGDNFWPKRHKDKSAGGLSFRKETGEETAPGSCLWSPLDEDVKPGTAPSHLGIMGEKPEDHRKEPRAPWLMIG